MISLEQALEKIFAIAKPIGTEITSLKKATGKILAKPIKAKLNQPPFDVSAMDGYAVIAKDIIAGICIKEIGTSKAGESFEGEVKKGQCVRIFTGAKMPKGADAVIMQEYAVNKGHSIAFSQNAKKYQHIRKMGQDFLNEQILLDVGAKLNPASIALCAASNNDKLEVYKTPQIAILATGDELVEPGNKVGLEQIISSNPYGLNALFTPFCKNISHYPITSDDEDKLKNQLKEILNSDADIIITTGGASVGKYDFVQPTLKSLGVKMDFYKIAIKPGKPLMFGSFENKLVFGLPGNPVSALITAIVAVLPAIRKIIGDKNPLGERLTLPLVSPLRSNGERRLFIRANIINEKNSTSQIEPIGEMDSANLSSFSKANALIIHPENAPAKEKNDLVEIIKL